MACLDDVVSSVVIVSSRLVAGVRGAAADRCSSHVMRTGTCYVTRAQYVPRMRTGDAVRGCCEHARGRLYAYQTLIEAQEEVFSTQEAEEGSY